MPKHNNSLYSEASLDFIPIVALDLISFSERDQELLDPFIPEFKFISTFFEIVSSSLQGTLKRSQIVLVVQ